MFKDKSFVWKHMRAISVPSLVGEPSRGRVGLSQGSRHVLLALGRALATALLRGAASSADTTRGTFLYLALHHGRVSGRRALALLTSQDLPSNVDLQSFYICLAYDFEEHVTTLVFCFAQGALLGSLHVGHLFEVAEVLQVQREAFILPCASRKLGRADLFLLG